MSTTNVATPEAATDPMDTFDITKDDLADNEPLQEQLIGGKPAETVAEEPAPEVAKAEAPTLPEGYTKDSLGRVHGPDGKIVSKEALAKLVPPAPVTAAEARKFAYRALSKTYEPEGFTENADGTVTITAEKVGELRAALNAKHVMEADTFPSLERLKVENQALQQQLEQTKTGTTAEVARANAIVAAYSKLLEEPDEEKSLVEFFKLRQDWPARLAKAEADHWRTLAQQGKSSAERQTPRTVEDAPYRDSLPTREQAVASTTDAIEHMRLEGKYRDLADKDWKQFSERLERTPYAYIRPATADEAKQYGVVQGQSVFDTDAVAADIEEYASSVRASREAAKSAADLAARNARSTQPSITAPPTPGGGGTPAKTSKKITNEKDLEDWLNSDEI